MAGRYDDAAAMCPFYQNGTMHDINCEGIHDSNYLTLRFKTYEIKNGHKVRYCDKDYKKCEVYKMLDGKYE